MKDPSQWSHLSYGILRMKNSILFRKSKSGYRLFGPYYILFLSIVLSLSLSSCFTGIESTKKISLSREDRKAMQPTAEEKFFPGLKGEPIESWQEGKEFMVTDSKAIIMLKPVFNSMTADGTDLKGEILKFKEVGTRMGADGTPTLTIRFSGDLDEYQYTTGKTFDSGIEIIRSNDIPMLIDLDMVKEANSLLKDKNVWTKTGLWYDRDGEKKDGRKFEPVRIIEVLPGNTVFPLKLKIEDTKGEIFYLFMNYGNSDSESRSFHNIFSLSDPRHHYPHIEAEKWELICSGKVAPGMSKEECKLSLGNPVDVSTGHDYSQVYEIWTYEDGKVLWFEDGILTRSR